jgi:hypothetical protein
MNHGSQRVLTGVAAAALAASVGAGLSVSNASAATSGRTFFASKASGSSSGHLVRVKLVGSKIVSSHNVAKAKGSLLYPQSYQRGSIAGLRATFDQSSSTFSDRIFTFRKGKLRTITPSTQDVSAATLFDKGKKVAYTGTVTKNHLNTWVIRVKPVTGGKAKTIFTAEEGQAISSLTTRNGKTFYFGASIGPDSRLYKFVRGHSSAKPLTKTINEANLSTVAIAPNGKTIAFAVDALAAPNKHAIRFKKIKAGGFTKSSKYQGFPDQLTWPTAKKLYFDDMVANGWQVINPAPGKRHALDATSTSPYTHPLAK